jgi:hypothetical protein
MTCKSALSTVSRDLRLLPIIEQVANVVLCLSVHSRSALLFELLLARPGNRWLCVGILRQDSTALGGGDRDVSQHAGGPFRLCHSGGLLARRAAGRVGIRRQHSTAVGGGDRGVSQHAGVPF